MGFAFRLPLSDWIYKIVIILDAALLDKINIDPSVWIIWTILS